MPSIDYDSEISALQNRVGGLEIQIADLVSQVAALRADKGHWLLGVDTGPDLPAPVLNTSDIHSVIHPTSDAAPALVGAVPTVTETDTVDPATETVHYADGTSATGPAPLPRVSPDGAPAVDNIA